MYQVFALKPKCFHSNCSGVQITRNLTINFDKLKLSNLGKKMVPADIVEHNVDHPRQITMIWKVITETNLYFNRGFHLLNNMKKNCPQLN